MKILLLLGLACSLTIKRLLYLESLSPLKYSQFASPQRFDKRDENVQSSTINTTSFILNFKCNAPFRDFNFSKCIAARESLRLGLIELEKYIFLPNQVIIDATFESFCADKFNPGAKCSGIGSQVLGRAAPAQMIELNEFEAKNLGLDSNYGYPSSLIRQYVPDEMGNVTSDISANFNSDYNWLVAPVPSEPNWGSSVVIQGGFFNQSNTVSFDLRQVAVHEFIHGMGFLSSWAVYFPTIFPKTFFPSVFDIDADKNVLGLSSQWIYDKLISDSVNGVWLSSYANSMKDSVKLALKNGGQRNWIEEFKNSSGYQVGQALYGDKGLFSTKNGLIIWYPWKESMKHAIISSPYPFAPGSSLSHLDSFVYSSVASFLMRPSATSFVKFESVNPGSGNPFGSVLLGIMRGMGYVVRQ